MSFRFRFAVQALRARGACAKPFVTIRAIGLLCVVAGCHHDCITTPCPLPIAAEITVTSATTHAPLDSITIRSKDGRLIEEGCSGTCLLSSGPGAYDVVISAPGYQPVERTFTVTATSTHPSVSGPDGYEGRSCGCEVDDTQHLSVELTPT